MNTKENIIILSRNYFTDCKGQTSKEKKSSVQTTQIAGLFHKITVRHLKIKFLNLRKSVLLNVGTVCYICHDDGILTCMLPEFTVRASANSASEWHLCTSSVHEGSALKTVLLLRLSDLCRFCGNMTELSPDLRQLLCE
ncbi:hypothetical protein T11_12751 [Trichinella zimbabwensis]|uniref:Uncharacterized protein n=1 Tax=Trichinella zimbabwensis TaxID=268475 RepID=A0A0V1HSJ5_9BILA|nr:hypothetical protein T11_12751 [Trichinella zimbabwensis]